MSNGWTFPVLGYNEKNITSNYGSRSEPTAGASTFHEGIDIAAPTGTSVVAAIGGKVSGVLRSAAKGNYITVTSGDTVTEYAHLDTVDVKAGDTIAQGTKIGTVGNTGISTGSHLDFRVKQNGSYIDPLTWNYSGNYNSGSWGNSTANIFSNLNGSDLLEFVKDKWLWITAGLLVYAVLTKKR